MKKNKFNNKKHIYIRELYLLRKKRRRLQKKKNSNYYKNAKKKHIYDNSLKIKNNYPFRPQIVRKNIEANQYFSLLEKPENVLSLISMIDVFKENKKINHIDINLSKIKSIDIGAICLILAKVNEVSTINNRIKVSGNFPEDESCKKIFIESGILDYMKDLYGRNFEKQSDNLLLKIGGSKTDNKKVGELIKKSICFLTGVNDHYNILYNLSCHL